MMKWRVENDPSEDRSGLLSPGRTSQQMLDQAARVTSPAEGPALALAPFTASSSTGHWLQTRGDVLIRTPLLEALREALLEQPTRASRVMSGTRLSRADTITMGPWLPWSVEELGLGTGSRGWVRGLGGLGGRRATCAC